MSAKDDRNRLFHYAAGVGDQPVKQYEPGKDMVVGVARAHVESPEEIAANPIEDAPVQTCEACSGTGTDLDFECPATESGVHVMNFELSEDEAEGLEPEPESKMDAATAESVLGIGLATAWRFQHAKVLRFEISVGADDDDTTIEEFENLARNALFAGTKISQLRYNHLTTLGGYYIIDGKVCLPGDYDPATKGRKPGTFPPPWAGGPLKGQEASYVAEHEPKAEPKDKAAAVQALAQGMNTQVKKGKKR